MRSFLALLAFSWLGAHCQFQAQVQLHSEITAVGVEGVTHRLYAVVPAGGLVQSMYAEAEAPFSLDAPLGIVQSDGQAVLTLEGEAGAMDSWWTIGMPQGITELQETGGANWNASMDAFAAGGSYTCDDEFGGAFFLFPSSAQGLATDTLVLLGQFISTGPITVGLNLQW